VVQWLALETATKTNSKNDAHVKSIEVLLTSAARFLEMASVSTFVTVFLAAAHAAFRAVGMR
jgi:hypothetical protein